MTRHFVGESDLRIVIGIPVPLPGTYEVEYAQENRRCSSFGFSEFGNLFIKGPGFPPPTNNRWWAVKFRKTTFGPEIHQAFLGTQDDARANAKVVAAPGTHVDVVPLETSCSRSLSSSPSPGTYPSAMETSR